MFCQWNCGWQPSAVITTILPYIYFLHRDIKPEHILISPLQPVRKLGVEAKALQHILGVVQGLFFWWSVRAGSSATMMSWAFGRLGICHVLPRCSFEPFPRGKMFNLCSTWNLWNQRLQLHQRQTISGKIGWLDGCHLTYSALGVGQANYSMVKMPRPVATSAWAWAHMLVHKPFQFFGICIYIYIGNIYSTY